MAQARFAGKTAIVTGAGSGIGLATAKLLIADGATVVAVDVSEPRLAEATTEIGPFYSPLAIDITTAEAPAAILAAAGGTVDILINNAGVMDGFVPVGEVDDRMWDLVIAINLTAPMRLTRAVLPGMIAQGHGTIVNLASEAALRSSCAGVAYSVSKAGIVALTGSTSTMYRDKHIRCNAVAPGGVATNVDGNFRSELAQATLGPVMSATMGNFFAQPEALASAICFLADDEASSNINGVVLPCDGGWSVV